jgi:hypothetical protein
MNVSGGMRTQALPARKAEKNVPAEPLRPGLESG